MALNWIDRPPKEVIADGTGLVTSEIRKHGTEPNVLVDANAAGVDIGTYISTAEAKEAIRLIIDP